MSKELEQELLNFGKWYDEHLREVSDVQKQLKFQQDAIDQLLWVFARAVQDIQRLEGRTPGAENIGIQGNPEIILTLDQIRRANSGRRA